MTTKWIVFSAPAPADAVAITVANGAAGYYTGIPPKWSGISTEQGWTLPCVIEEDEEGNVVSWAPVVA
jgi:hypothetical protein